MSSVVTIKSLSEDEYEKAEEREINEWHEMLDDWDKVDPKHLKRKIRRGIPDIVREQVWLHLIDVDNLKKEIGDVNSIDTTGVPQLSITTIDNDVDRVFPELDPAHGSFDKDSKDTIKQYYNDTILIDRVKLKRVAVLYAALDTELRYLQPFGYIIAFLLMCFNANIDNAFYTFYYLMQKKGFRNNYTGDYPRMLFIFDRLANTHIRDIMTHLRILGLTSHGYLPSWVDTMFARDSNFDLTRRVVDICLYEGSTVLCRVSMAILNNMKHDIMDSDADAGDIQEFMDIRNYRYQVINPHELMHDAYMFNIPKAEITKYEEEYKEEEAKPKPKPKPKPEPDPEPGSDAGSDVIHDVDDLD
jgi:hypothetical protein